MAASKQASKQASKHTHARAQCSPASVGLAQAHPNQGDVIHWLPMYAMIPCEQPSPSSRRKFKLFPVLPQTVLR